MARSRGRAPILDRAAAGSSLRPDLRWGRIFAPTGRAIFRRARPSKEKPWDLQIPGFPATSLRSDEGRSVMAAARPVALQAQRGG